MRRFWSVLLFTSLLIPSTWAFRDLSPNSKIYPAVQSLIERGVLKQGSFFRQHDHVPAKMFWEILLRDAGFDPNSATFGTPLPPNVEDDEPIAQFLREAIRRGFIDDTKPFNGDHNLTRIEAIRLIVRTKGIRTEKKISNQFFRKAQGVPRVAAYGPYAEAAYASGILEDEDIRPLNAYGLLTRRDFVRWLHNFETKGEKKSTLNPNPPAPGKTAAEQRRYPYQQRRSQNRRTRLRIDQKGNVKNIDGGAQVIRIQMLDNEQATAAVRRSSGGLLIPNGKIMEDVFAAIESKYRFRSELTDKQKRDMMDAAISAMVNAMGDKYSAYVEPEKTDNYRAGLQGEFEGIGAYVEMVDGEFTITAPIKGSPAEAAGIQPGDVVTHVDDESVIGYSITKTVNMIKGPAGSEVKLTLMRGTQQYRKEVHVTVTRGQIKIPSITIEWEKSVPIIGIHRFNQATKRDFQKLITEEVLPKNPRGIVLDLRNNPGGFLTSAVDMGEFFLAQDDLIFSVDYHEGKREYKARRTGELHNKFKQDNVVVLQNRGSASASEIFASMIQDYEMGVVLGTKSVGKGTVQELLNQNNGSLLKLTVAKWLTPKGRWIQAGETEDHGVIPDIEETDQTAEERQQKIDRQRDKAVRHILNH